MSLSRSLGVSWRCSSTASQHKGTRTAQGHTKTMEGMSYEKDAVLGWHKALVLLCQHSARVLIGMTGREGPTTS